jgi:hypothetical protein
MPSTAQPFTIRVVRPRDRKVLVVVDYASGGRAYARIDRDKASLGGACLSAAADWRAAEGRQAPGPRPLTPKLDQAGVG